MWYDVLWKLANHIILHSYYQCGHRVHLFWVKMISGNHFHHFPHVWLSRKIIFSGKWLPVDQYFHIWPGNDFLPSFSLQSISGKRERERARVREEKKPNSQSISRRRRSPVRVPGGAISQRSPRRSRSRDRRRDLAPSRDRAVASSRLRSRSTARDRTVARSRSQIDREIAQSRARAVDREIAISDRDRWWYFSWVYVFLLLFQTLKNIFRKIFWNATKHREIFSFSGN